MAQYVTNLDLYVALQNCTVNNKKGFLFNLLTSRLPSDVSGNDIIIIKKFITTFMSNFQRKWTKAHRHAVTFTKQNLSWLNSNIRWPSCGSVDLHSIFSREIVDTTQEDFRLLNQSMEAGPSYSVPSYCHIGTNTPGKRRKAFGDLTNKQKKRRSGSLLDHDEEEITFALVSKLKERGNKQLAEIIECLFIDTVKVLKTHDFLFKTQPTKSFPETETLALLNAINLSKYQYYVLRKTLIEKELCQLPSYQKILTAKKLCYPPSPDDIMVTETGAKVKLQALLDLTAKKLIKITGVHFKLSVLKLICKWGCDGSSSHSTYKQNHNAGDTFSDSSVFMVSLVPLRLMCGDTIAWENPRPSATAYCRPVMFEFIKETEQVIKLHTDAINEEISNLVPTKVDNVEVLHELHMTMIDGKVATVLSKTNSSANCSICLVKPKEMNNWEIISKKPPLADMYKYGLSSLHMWMRCMECILHISYNLDFKQWAARGEHKLLKATKKNLTQRELFQRMGLLVDIVKQGFGTTNDGNTARRFFRDYKNTAEITTVDENLIKRFAVILQAISSGKNIDIGKFRSYCRDTAQLYISLYPWYYMPSSIHKLLIHGADICQQFSFIPIGKLSEEASEARNKDFRHTRERHSRKKCRKNTNEDIINYFLVSSDPYLSHLKPMYKKTHMILFPEAIDLLLEETVNETSEDEDEVYVDMDTDLSTDPLSF
jgi:hypothetical protein